MVGPDAVSVQSAGKILRFLKVVPALTRIEFALSLERDRVVRPRLLLCGVLPVIFDFAAAQQLLAADRSRAESYDESNRWTRFFLRNNLTPQDGRRGDGRPQNWTNVTARITVSQTDLDLPKHVKNGYMRYRDFQPLTQGGEAMLQTCLDENLGRVVVMKTLLPQLANLEVYRRRFLREARVTAQIPHPATVPVYEISRDRDGNVYFTMKKLGGRDLSDILDRIAAGDELTIREFPLDQLLSVMIRVGQCLAYAHSMGIVHRDVKPGNVMVGDYGEVTLLDWGLAKVADMEDDDEVEQLMRSGQKEIPGRLTGRGDVQGTPFYMSPEQARETGDVDGRTDIYNMGIILFEMLTNQSMMSGRNFKDIKRKILKDPVRAPADVTSRKAVHPELNAICLKALMKNPDDRYQTMNDLTADLRAHLLGQPVSVYHIPPVIRLLKASSRRLLDGSAWLWMVVGALLVLIFLALRDIVN